MLIWDTWAPRVCCFSTPLESGRTSSRSSVWQHSSCWVPAGESAVQTTFLPKSRSKLTVSWCSWAHSFCTSVEGCSSCCWVRGCFRPITFLQQSSQESQAAPHEHFWSHLSRKHKQVFQFNTGWTEGATVDAPTETSLFQTGAAEALACSAQLHASCHSSDGFCQFIQKLNTQAAFRWYGRSISLLRHTLEFSNNTKVSSSRSDKSTHLNKFFLSTQSFAHETGVCGLHQYIQWDGSQAQGAKAWPSVSPDLSVFVKQTQLSVDVCKTKAVAWRQPGVLNMFVPSIYWSKMSFPSKRPWTRNSGRAAGPRMQRGVARHYSSDGSDTEVMTFEMEQRQRGISQNRKCLKKEEMVYHGKANISFLEGGAIVGTVPCHCHHLSCFSHRAVNDAWLKIDADFISR